jgi:hypothetical protein
VQVSDVDPETGAGVALRVEVHHEHPVARLGEARAQVHGRRGLPDATLLVGHGEHPGERPHERRHLVLHLDLGDRLDRLPVLPLEGNVDRRRLDLHLRLRGI